MSRLRLLCVDDEPSIRSLYRNLLGSYGYEVYLAENGAQALSLLKTHKVDAVILDYEMPGMNGGEVAAEIKHRAPTMPILMVSGCSSVVDDAPRFVDAALTKGSPVEKLLSKLDMLMGNAASRLTAPISPARFAPLGSALATVAVATFLMLRIL